MVLRDEFRLKNARIITLLVKIDIRLLYFRCLLLSRIKQTQTASRLVSLFDSFDRSTLKSNLPQRLMLFLLIYVVRTANRQHRLFLHPFILYFAFFRLLRIRTIMQQLDSEPESALLAKRSNPQQIHSDHDVEIGLITHQ